ncbi:gliding motility-associated-like protein [Flavobacterium sp. 1]|uniref:HYR domain-containing protein n=1 Tax=Flavobacterium sp. 1 TaxID=2035200 RepID=UPI000C244273|nr:HYR domain-containing protein [Flavobacterium sp. 1]PJJ08618.1 gliding motility-associated-like protein [Flavobacterium sp. 1]
MRNNVISVQKSRIFYVITILFLLANSLVSYSQGCPEVPKSILNGTNGFSIEGKASADELGTTTKSAGDINHDGIPDIMIGAPGADFGGLNNVGEIYVIYGKAGLSINNFDVTALDGTNGFVIRGVVANEKLGTTISTAGDLNNDGIDDIIVGDNFATQGTAFVLFGSAAAFLPLYNRSDLNASNSVVFTANFVANTYVIDVSTAGDVNKDGINDVIINVGTGSYGQYFIVFGKSGISSLNSNSLNGTNGFRIDGYQIYYSGWSSIGRNAGDINNDGVDDLILGISHYNEGSVQYSGRAIIWYGKSTAFAPLYGLGTMTATDGTVITNDGAFDYEALGTSVASAGDFNNDGIDDVVVGAPGKKINGLSSVGEAYIVFGRNTPFPATFPTSSLNASTGVVFQGKKAFGELGTVVNSLKDVNNDGKDDVIIASRKGGLALNGAVFVVFGGTTATGILNENMIFGTKGYQVFNDDKYYSTDYFGQDAGGIGDFNKDGTNDFIVGSIPKSYSPLVNGNAYVFYGEKLNRIDNEVPTISSPQSERLLYVNSTLPNYVSFLDNVYDNCTDNMDLIFTQNPPQGTLFTADTNVTITVADKSGNTNSCTFLIKVRTDMVEINCKTTTLDISDLNGNNGFRIYGEIASREVGFSVNSAGDVNGDGIDDFIIGAPGNYNASYGKYFNEFRIVKGAAYVVYGTSAGFPPNVDLGLLNGTNGFAIRNDNPFLYSTATGHKVGSAGDINGDGIGDFMISDPFRDQYNTGSQVGYTYIVFGKAGGFPAEFFLSTLDGTNGFSLIGSDDSEAVGINTDKIGDINGDGIQDIAAITGGSSAVNGKCFVVYGSHSTFPAVLRTNQINGTNGFSIQGDATAGAVGDAISGLGDINGDGISDMGLGGYNGSGQIRKFVIYGRSSNFPAVFDLSTLNGSNGFVLENSSNPLASYLGISKAGDINGDGYNDIAVARDYILFGGTTIPALMDLKNLNGTNGFKITNIYWGDSFGTAGDFNKDGFGDYVFQNGPDFNILFGKNIWTPIVNRATLGAKDVLIISSDGSSANYSVNYAGDVNNDGISDIIIGNSIDSYGSWLRINRSPGFAYVVFGKQIAPDTEKPVITDCPNNKVLAVGSAIPNYKTDITVTDNCDSSPVVTQDPVAGTIFAGGLQTITLTATDAKSNFSTCSFTISSVGDTQAPTIICPSNQLLACGSATIPNYISMVTVSDNTDPSPTITQSPAAGSPFVSGMTITMTAKDASNNTQTCSFLINASADVTKPVITCIGNQTLSCGTTIPSYIPLITVTDNCDASPTITQSPIAGSPFVDGMTITMTAKDVSNNTQTCSFLINASADVTKPVITCIGNQTLSCGSTIPNYIPSITATDNCDASPTITQSPAAGSPFVSGMTITMTAKDASNNTQTCSFLINASADVTKPVITCIGNQTLSCGATVPNYIPLIIATDNCDASPIITQNPIAGSPFVSGMTITMTAKDASKNTQTCSFLVNASADVTKPVITCIGNQTLSCGATVPNYIPLITATDNCDASPTITQSPIAGSPFVSGMTITMTAKDASNNTQTCSFLINASADVTKPVITCIGNQILSCGATIPNYIPLITATDNCDASPTITQSPIAGSPFVDGMTITMTAKDASNNTQTCSFLVNASADVTKPVITCIGNQILSCGATVPNYIPLIIATDNCDPSPIITQNPIAGSPFVPGMKITMTAKDVSNNSEVCSFLVIASADVTKPVITCIGNQILSCGATIPNYIPLIIATDNCDPSPIITQSPIAGSPFVDGMTITMTAKDASNNSSNCSFIINASADIIKPNITCSGNKILISGAVLPSYISTVTVSDNCDALPIITQSPVAGSPFTNGMTVVISAKDASGNIGSCSLVVNEIADMESPKITCLSDQYIACSITKIPDYTTLVTVKDNQDANPIVTQSPLAGSPFTVGMTVTITATDASKNNSKCSFKLFENSVSVNAGSDVYIQEGEQVYLQAVATTEGSFNWNSMTGLNNSSISNPIASPLETTTYTVIFKNIEGCTAEDAITIYVEQRQKDDTKYGFSPDNDGINDFWYIDTIDQFPKNEVSIYNRWGDLVFQIKGYNNTTNVFTGVANRKRNLGADLLPEGTYFFEIKTEAASHLKKHKGYLVLKR